MLVKVMEMVQNVLIVVSTIVMGVALIFSLLLGYGILNVNKEVFDELIGAGLVGFIAIFTCTIILMFFTQLDPNPKVNVLCAKIVPVALVVSFFWALSINSHVSSEVPSVILFVFFWPITFTPLLINQSYHYYLNEVGRKNVSIK